MTRRIRVLLVDDSDAMREVLAQAIIDDPLMEVVGHARDGEEAVAATHRYRPDVISMDLMMPKGGGLHAISRIMAERPTPIVVLSALSRSAAGLEAIQAGALEVTAKPEAIHTPEGRAALRNIIKGLRLMSEVKVMTRPRRASTAPSGATPNTAPAVQPDLSRPRPSRDKQEISFLAPTSDFRCICIASSTGGPPALRSILAALPADYPIPIVIVQHIGEGFGAGLVAWLDGLIKLRVLTARYGQAMEPGNVYFAPDDLHLEIGSRGRFMFSGAAPIRSHRPSADPLFATAASVFGAETLGMVLTGMGRDGVDGIAALKNAGGTVVAQDEQSCVVYGMPKAVIDAGLSDYILSLDQMPSLLLSLKSP